MDERLEHLGTHGLDHGKLTFGGAVRVLVVNGGGLRGLLHCPVDARLGFQVARIGAKLPGLWWRDGVHGFPVQETTPGRVFVQQVDGQCGAGAGQAENEHGLVHRSFQQLRVFSQIILHPQAVGQRRCEQSRQPLLARLGKAGLLVDRGDERFQPLQRMVIQGSVQARMVPGGLQYGCCLHNDWPAKPILCLNA